MNIVFSTAFFLFFISCVSKEPTDQKKYSVVLPRYLQDTVIVTYKLDSLYKEVNPGIELWAAQDAKKYKKDHYVKQV